MAESGEINKTVNTSTLLGNEKQGQRSVKDAIKAKLNRRNLSTAPFCVNGGAIQIQNASNVHLGNIVSLGANPNLKPQEPQPEVTTAVTALLENEEEITNFHRLAVDFHVGSDWRFLGKELAGLSNGQMDQLEEPYKANQYPFREVIYQMLLMWEGHSETTPTVGLLAKALWKCKMYVAFMSLLETVNVSRQK